MRGIPLSLLTFCLLAAAAAGEDAPRAVPVVETPATEADAIPRGPDFETNRSKVLARKSL